MVAGRQSKVRRRRRADSETTHFANRWLGPQSPVGFQVKLRKARALPWTRWGLRPQTPTIKNRCRNGEAKNACNLLLRQAVKPGGKSYGGQSMGRGALYHLLRNRLYLGEVPHKGTYYPGRHPPIIDRDLFEAVQLKLGDTAVALRPNRPNPHSGAPLAIFDAGGNRMSPVSARRQGGVTYRYYVSHPLQSGGKADRQILQRVPAGPVEEIVVDRLCRIGWVACDADPTNWPGIRSVLTRVDLAVLAVAIRAVPPCSARLDLRALRDRLPAGDTVEVAETGVTRTVSACFSRRSGSLVALNPNGGNATVRVNHDRTLSTALLRAEA